MMLPRADMVEPERQCRGQCPANGPGQPDACGVHRHDFDKEICQHHTEHQVGECGGGEISDGTGAAEYPVTHGFDHDHKVERRYDPQEHHACMDGIGAAVIQEQTDGKTS